MVTVEGGRTLRGDHGPPTVIAAVAAHLPHLADHHPTLGPLLAVTLIHLPPVTTTFSVTWSGNESVSVAIGHKMVTRRNSGHAAQKGGTNKIERKKRRDHAVMTGTERGRDPTVMTRTERRRNPTVTTRRRRRGDPAVTTGRGRRDLVVKTGTRKKNTETKRRRGHAVVIVKTRKTKTEIMTKMDPIMTGRAHIARGRVYTGVRIMRG